MDVQVKDLHALKAACKGLGLEFVSGQTAFMSGRLRHKGDMSLLMRLPSLFGI